MISVIVPVYNVEKYLERCANSILAQTYRDFELLLVDDGSTDGSGAMCDKLARSDGRVRVLHKENGGLSDARNFGLDHMRGEYVTFIDSDDYIGPKYLQVLIGMMENKSVDMTVVSMVSVSTENVEFLDSNDETLVWSRDQAFKEIAVGRKTGVSACAKLFKAALFIETRFPKGRYYEDMLTTPYVIEKCDQVCYSSSVQYYYYQRDDSIMHSVSDKKVDDWNEGIEKLYQYANRYFPRSKDCVICRYINHGFDGMINKMIDGDGYVKRAREFQRRHMIWWRKALTNPYLTRREKVRTLLFMISPVLYRTAYKANHGMK